MDENLVSCVSPLSFPAKTYDPYLFLVYHKDMYPQGDEGMRAPKRGNGSDFNPSADYRMYHGDRIPGFPQHPHRGFETITATIEGLVDHSDSMGNGGRYGMGDLQWMTAGRGIQHSEMFPLIHKDKPNPLRFFQIWLNLPAKDKMCDPDFVMHWAEDVSKFRTESGATVTVWVGDLDGHKALTPPIRSYAADRSNDVGLYFIQLDPGAEYTLPAAAGAPHTQRRAYFIEGSTLEIGNTSVSKLHMADVSASMPARLRNLDDTQVAEVLIMQGKPISEPVAQYGPFVMNTRDQIAEAFSDYRKTEFGGWPWPQSDHIFPREKGRFALQDGKETYPPAPPKGGGKK